MEFKKFNSLENTYRQNLIDKVQYEGKNDGLWIVTEKIHGANFSFWCDGNQVKVGSRSQFVDGTFYNCQAVIDRYSEAVLQTHHCICKPGDILVIYGELFGDGIQKEVKYGEKDFRAFDVMVNGEIKNKIEAFNLVRFASINTAPVLHTGAFKECMEINNVFRSLLTPENYENDNFAEGVVIEPIQPNWFTNGSRIYFKNKTEAFSEKKRQPKEKKVFELSEEENNLLNLLLEYNTESRVSNVISKIGQVSNKDFGRILGLTLQDLMEDFTKDTSRNPKEEVANWKDFLKMLQAEVTQIMRSEFLKHVGGN